MNKNQYRLLYNAARNQLMVVPEHASSKGGTSTNAIGNTTRSANLAVQSNAFSVASHYLAQLKRLSFAALRLLALPAVVSLAALHANAAGVVADQAAPANQRPLITNAANGVPVVNIQTPSAAGVSHNTYSQFDVSSQGVILNNSSTNVSTQLGGYIQGNPYVPGTTARVILNEVNSPNPSLLHGYIEVAGSRAQVIVANPSGISCDGCGFINTSRATLTTGTPIMSGGDLIGYRVTGGTINFLGAGLDTANTNYTDVIARAVQVNASLFANKLNVITGSNQVNVASAQNGTDAYISSITPIAGTGSAPTFAVDVAALGGMYAGKIHLVATEAGVGVRNAGNVGASAGNVVIDANGMLSNSGTLSSRGAGNNLAINTQGLDNSGTISAQNNISIANQGALQNSGLITADRELKLDTSDQLTNNHGTLSAQRLDIHAASLSNNQGTIQQTGLQALNLTMQGLTNVNNGVIGNIPMVVGTAGGTTGNGSTGNGSTGATSTPPTTAANGSAVVTTPSAPVLLADGVMMIQGLSTNDGGQITANGKVTATVSHTLANSASINLATIDFTGTSFSNASGTINVAQATINTNLLDNSQGQFIASDTLHLVAHDVRNVQGNLQQLGLADLSIDLLGNLDNTQGHIETNATSLTLAANQITNSGGSIIHAGTGNLNITSTTLNGTAGLIQSNGALSLIAQSATLDQATTIASQISIDSATLSNKGGHITQTGTAATSISASTGLDNSGGTIASNANSSLAVGSLINQGGLIQAAGTSSLNVNATGAIDNSALNGVTGNLQAGGSATLTASSLNNSQSKITAGNTLSVTTTQAIDNSQGLVAANQALALHAASINNSSGTIASVLAGVDLNATAGLINNTLGHITAAQTLNTNSVGLNNTDGTLLANQISTDSQLQAFDNTRGSVISSTSLDVQTGVLTNAAGLMQSGNTLTINTHGQTLTNSNSGSSKGILSQGILSLTTGDLNNQSGFIGAKGAIAVNSAAITNGATIANTTAGVITSEATIALNANSLNNQTGHIEALANIDVNAGNGIVNNSANSINNQQGLLRSGQTLSLTAGSIDNRNTQGSNQGIEAHNVSIAADAINNTIGAMRADNLLRIVDSGSLNNSQGLISSSTSLTIADAQANANSNVATKTLSITNTGGTLIAASNLTIDSRSLTGDGKVLSQGDLSVSLLADYTNSASAQLQASNNLNFTSAGALTNQAKLQAGNSLNVSAAMIDNQANAEISANTTHLQTNNSGSITNRGLIDGSDTFIETGTLNNLGTGRIYGDHIAIAAINLNNDVETLGGVSHAAVIAARSRLDLGVSNAITNREHALIFSAGDLAIGGSLDASHLATTAAGSAQAATLNNNSATIEATGKLGLNIANINNTNEHFSTHDVLISAQNFDEFQGQGGLTRYTALAGTGIYPGLPSCGGDCFNTYNTTINPNAYATSVRDDMYQWVVGGTQYRNSYRFVYSSNTTETQVLSSEPGQIQSGGTMQINANNLLNDKSKIVAGGALTGIVGNLNNTSVSGQRTTTDTGTTYVYITHDPSGGGNDYTEIQTAAYNPAATVQAITLTPSEYAANTAITGSGTTVASLNTSAVNQTATGANIANAAVNNAANQSGSTQLGSVSAASTTATLAITKTVSPNLTLPNNSLFSINPNASNHYLVETDPRFANYRTWLSSDYMLNQLNLDPAYSLKRLGDGFYEQKLIREQVAELTGRRFLVGYANDEAEYLALMNNGVTSAKAFNLQPGIALSASQIAQLTSDIVWLVEQTVTLPAQYDSAGKLIKPASSTQVLMPQLYVSVKAGDLNANGALISADSTNLNITGDLNNSNGTIAGRTVLALNANNINNLGGRLTATDVNVHASNDLNNLGGSIDAQHSLIASAGHDLNVISSTSTQSNATGSRTNISRVAGLYVTGNAGLLIASAGHDLHLDGAQIVNNSAGNTNSNTSQTILQAGHDLSLGTVKTSEQNNITWNSKNTLKQGSSTDNGSSIQSNGNITLNAGHDANLKAASISSGDSNSKQGNLSISAANTLNISTGQTSASAVGNTSYGYGTTASTASALKQGASSLSAGNNLSLQSGSDTHITSANLSAGNNLDVAATGNLTIDAAKDSSQLDYAYNAKNKRDIIRNQDETVIASNINAGKHISLTATGQKIEDGGQRTGFPLPNPLPEGEGASKGGKLTLNSANLNSQTGAVTLNAAQDVTIGTTAETHDHYEEHYTKTKSLLSRKSSLTIDQSQDTLAIGSSISGDTVTVNAGLPSTSGRGAGGEGEASATGNITITGSNVVATHDTTLNAQNNINISAAQETHNESHFTETKKSGFSSSGASISLGKSKLTTTSDTQSITNTASTVGSVQGNTNIKAGKTYTQTGSDILTPKGDINIAAQSVTIQNATDTNANQQTMQYKLSGITLAVTSPVISAIQTAQQMSKAASQTKDSRMQLLAAGTAALAANNAKDALGKVDQFGNIATAGSTGADDLTHVREANAADQVGGINVSLSIGSSKSSSETKQTSTTAASSHLNAGGDINITATGAGQDSNINVIGSQIKAYSDVTLKADHNINLQAAQNVDTLNSKSKGSSASIGVSFGTDGFLVTASASGSKGKAKGNGSTWTETVVQSGNNAGDKVTLNSGTDTNIIGAQVIGNQVIADVGTSGQGNLNIQSLQDRNQYTDKQQSVGGSISVGYGKMGGSINASKSSTKSNYASVNEQSGIMAGDGGFQVNVAGNTDLKGAVIASSDKAIKNNLNSLTTQTLTTANIENKAEYSAKGMSVSAGVGLNKQADGTFKNAPTASAGNSNLSDDRSSVTVSGISGGTVSITSPRPQAGEGQGEGLSGADQIAHLNRDVQTKLNTTTDAQGNTITTATAVDSAGHNLAGTLTPIFDKEQVQREINAQIQITQAFSQVAPKAVGDYASNQVKDLIRQAQEADIAGDKTKAAGLLAEAEKWNDGGVYRVALHTALGGLLTGDITGAASAGTVASAAPLLNTLQAQVQTQLEQAGISTSVAATISQGIAELTSVGIGSAIGGSAGAGVALAVDTNNRQLHPTEIDWIKANARAYARQLNNGKEPNAQQIRAAEEDLAQQAFRQVQFGVSGVWDVQAYEFLRAGTRSGAMLTADPNFPLSAPAPLFFASPQERANSAIYLSSALNNTSFYQNNQLSQPTITQINAGIADYTKKNNIAYNATIAAVALPTALLVGTVASAPTVVAAVSNFINTAIAACTGNLVLCINQAAIEAAGLIEGAPITTTIAAGATTKAAQEIKVAAEELQEATRLVRAVDSAKGAMPTLPTGMTSPEFGVLAGWGKKSQGAWDKLAIGYTDAEIQALKNAGVTRGDIESWKATYETIARLTVGNPQDTPIPRARLMQLIMEKW